LVLEVVEHLLVIQQRLAAILLFSDKLLWVGDAEDPGGLTQHQEDLVVVVETTLDRVFRELLVKVTQVVMVVVMLAVAATLLVAAVVALVAAARALVPMAVLVELVFLLLLVELPHFMLVEAVVLVVMEVALVVLAMVATVQLGGQMELMLLVAEEVEAVLLTTPALLVPLEEAVATEL
jgi:hypothetical protein